MERKNAFVLAHELAERKDWAKAYEICKEYLDSEENDDSWEVLGLEEQEEIALLKIECVIKTILLQELFSGEYNDGLMVWNDDCDEIVDILSDSIYGLSGHILLAESEIKGFEQYYSKVSLMAKEHYLLMLDDIIALISGDSRDGTLKNYVTYSNGYLCLCQIIMQAFGNIADSLEIEGYKFNKTHYNEAITYQKDKLFNRAIDITQMISQATNDFPYFNSMDAAYMYISAICLAEISLPNKSESSALDTRIARLKHKINLSCDFLNAIYVTQGQRVSLCISETHREKTYNDILVCEKEIQEFEFGYSRPQVNKEKFSTVPENKKSGGCYVATAVYGSYDCPQVWTLRRYRDYTLAETWRGRAFIKTYYAISPLLVKWFGHTEWFKKMWQSKLDRMVAKLQSNGVESTPYEDKEWR